MEPKFWLEDKLLPDYNMSEGNVLYNFETPKGVWENVLTCNIFDTYFHKIII